MESNFRLHVRSAEQRDVTCLAKLFSQLGFPCSSKEVSTRLHAAEDIALVAVVEDHVMGVVTINVMPVLHRPHPVGRISALVVDQSARGTGIGTLLVEAAETLLASRGCELVEVTSNFRLEAAHGFYKALGYESTSYRFKKEVRASANALGS